MEKSKAELIESQSQVNLAWASAITNGKIGLLEFQEIRKSFEEQIKSESNQEYSDFENLRLNSHEE